MSKQKNETQEVGKTTIADPPAVTDHRPTDGPPKRRYRLLVGIHKEHGEDRVYSAKDPAACVVETSRDLVKIYGSSKFALMAPGEVVHVPQESPTGRRDEDGLDAMSPEELKLFAASEGIDLAGVDDPNAVRDRIRSAMAIA